MYQSYASHLKTKVVYLPNSIVSEKDTIELGNFINLNYFDFSLSRFLAGNRSIKQARAVSRKRLALVSSDIGYIDPEAIKLKMQIDSYKSAKKII